MGDESSKNDKIFDIMMSIFSFCSIWLPFIYLISTIFQFYTEIIKWISTVALLFLTFYSLHNLSNLHDAKLKERRKKDIEYRKRVKKYKLRYRWENYITSLAQQNIDYPASVKYLMDKGYKTLSQKIFAYCVTIETLIVSNDKFLQKNLCYLLLFNLLMFISYASVFIFLHLISKKGNKLNSKDYVFISYTLMINFIFPIIFFLFVLSLVVNIKQYVIVLYFLLLLVIIFIVVSLLLTFKAVDKKKKTLKK